MQAGGGLKQINPKEVNKVFEGNYICFYKIFLMAFSNHTHQEWLK